ncbi:MAG: flagellar hook-length control protein FliK [Mycobacterium leprae]
MQMLAGGIGPSLIRLQSSPDDAGALKTLLAVGRVLEAEVLSVTGDRAVLVVGRGNRLEVRPEFPIAPGQRLQLQVLSETDSPGQLLLKLLGVESAPPTPQTPAQSLPVWLPIPMPQGSQGWAQLSVPEEDRRKPNESSMPAERQVRIWWETPALGKVEVQLSERAGKLTAVFTVPSTQSRDAIDADLQALRQQLAAVGFAEAVLGSRPPRPGETVEPVGGGASGLLDRRI